jgi:hypothetical protein
MKKTGNFPKSVFSLKSLFFLFILSFAAVLFTSRQFAPRAASAEKNGPGEERLENYDIRTDKAGRARKAVERFVADAGKTELQVSEFRKSALEAAQRLIRAKGANLKIEYNEDLLVPEVISPDFNNKAAFLTSPSGRKRAEVLKDFIRQNADLFGLDATQIDGLETAADYTNPKGPMSFVHFGQKIGNIPVFRGEVKAGFTSRGEIVRIINNLAPRLDYENLSADFGSAA